MALKKIAGVGVLLMLGACTNLAAVTGFATLGSSLTSSTSIIDSYTEATKEAARMAPPAEAAARQQQAAQAADQTKVADLGMKTLSLYFSALAQLSDNKLVDVKSSGSSIEASLKGLRVVPSSVSAPATSLISLLISAPLDAWRRAAVGNLINSANSSVQELGISLANFAAVTAGVYDADVHQADVFYGQLAAVSHDPATRYMLGEWRDQNINSYMQARERAKAASVALLKIVQGQADLEAHSNDLTSVELKALLAQYESDILGAAKLF